MSPASPAVPNRFLSRPVFLRTSRLTTYRTELSNILNWEEKGTYPTLAGGWSVGERAVKTPAWNAAVDARSTPRTARSKRLEKAFGLQVHPATCTLWWVLRWNARRSRHRLVKEELGYSTTLVKN
eukprot:3303472-Pyramimonas_sp.AAC.2